MDGLTKEVSPKRNSDYVGEHVKKKNKKEFSKIIIVLVGIINVIVVGFTLVMIWRTMDLSPLCYLIPAIAAEFSAGTVAYYSKAKVENRIKLMSHYGVEPSEHAFSDSF